MKLNFFKKLALLFAAGFGMFALASCQSTNVNEARFELDKCYVNVVEETSTGDHYAEYGLYVVNNTIYDIYSWDITFEGFDSDKQSRGTLEAKDVVLRVSHGVGGFIIGKEKLEDKEVTSIKVTSANVHTHYDLWVTYLGWWIAAIVILALSYIFFAIAIFTRGVRRADLVILLKERTETTLITALFALLICLIPIFFGGWVVTLIFVGTLLASILGCGLLTLVRKATLKD